MKVVALIPLRGGSKSIPLKNIKLIAGKPLCYWVIEAAVKSKIFDKVIVSTDSIPIIKEINKYNFDTLIIDNRPDNISTDDTPTESVMLYITKKYDIQILYTMQATSPLTDENDIKDSFKFFIDKEYDSLLTGVRSKRFYWNDNNTPLNYDPIHRPRRQDFSGSIIENGAIYITKREILLEHKCRLGGKIGIYEMSGESNVEIDEPDDWNIVEKELLKKKVKLGDIKLFVTDVDGVLTNSGIYYDNTDNEMKKFNTRDGKGFELIQKLGIKTGIITSESTEIVRRRADKLKVDYLFQGCSNKLNTIKQLMYELSISLDQVLFVGDDLNDLEVMKYIKYSFCPSDAVSDIKDSCYYILSKEGGEGCVRELCDILLKKCGDGND